MPAKWQLSATSGWPRNDNCRPPLGGREMTTVGHLWVLWFLPFFPVSWFGWFRSRFGSKSDSWFGSKSGSWLGSKSDSWFGSKSGSWLGSKSDSWFGSKSGSWLGSKSASEFESETDLDSIVIRPSLSLVGSLVDSLTLGLIPNANGCIPLLACDSSISSPRWFVGLCRAVLRDL